MLRVQQGGGFADDEGVKLDPGQSASTAKTHVNSRGGRCQIVILDDLPSIIEMLAAVLERAGYAVASYGDKAAFLQALRAGSVSVPDLILTDVNSPGMDGLQLLGALKVDANFRHVPVIVMTAYVTKSSESDAIQLGACAFLAKPFKEDKLLRTIESALNYATAGPLAADDCLSVPGVGLPSLGQFFYSVQVGNAAENGVLTAESEADARRRVRLLHPKGHVSQISGLGTTQQPPSPPPRPTTLPSRVLRSYTIPTNLNFGGAFFFGLWVLIGIGMCTEAKMFPIGSVVLVVSGLFLYPIARDFLRWRVKVDVTENTVVWGASEIPFADIRNLELQWVRTKHSLNFMPTGESQSVEISVTLDNGECRRLYLTETTGFHGCHRNLKQQLASMRDLYAQLEKLTFKVRSAKYFSEYKRTNFFAFGDVRMQPPLKIFVGKKEISLQEYGFICAPHAVFLRPLKYEGALTKFLMRGVYAIPATKDRDVLLMILSNLYGVRVTQAQA